MTHDAVKQVRSDLSEIELLEYGLHPSELLEDPDGVNAVEEPRKRRPSRLCWLLLVAVLGSIASQILSTRSR